MWKQVVPLFVIAVLFGWMMPASDPVAKQPAPAAVETKPQNIVAPKVTEHTPSGFDEVGAMILYRAADGHFYAPGNADGTALRFLIDTGASVVALTQGDAERLGYFVNPGELSVVGRGVGGEVQGKAITIAHLSIGEISATNVPAVIIPDGLPVSLLGQSFLSRIGQVNISDNQMTLKN